MCATFLGDSQTFFGVLVTLTVVCLFLDQNNFIVEFLKNIQDVFVKKIADMHQDIVSKTKVSWGKNTDKQNKTFEFYYKNAGQYFCAILLVTYEKTCVTLTVQVNIHGTTLVEKPG